jgi:hypothetical protein
MLGQAPPSSYPEANLPNDLSKPELQKLRGRDWPAIREAWLSFIPRFPNLGALPDSSSDDLLDVLGFTGPTSNPVRLEQIVGIRSAVLWEAVCLYQKAKHTNVAAKELLNSGLQTWSLFNFYHSAYLAAKGTMYLLGVTVPLVKSKWCILDIFASPENHQNGRRVKHESLTDFIAIPLSGLDQHQLWAWFQRLLSSTRSVPWDKEIAREIFLITESRDFVRQRNRLLYRPGFWLADDLLAPLPLDVPWNTPPRQALDPREADFLAGLCDRVHSIFDSALADLSTSSLPIRMQMNAALAIAVTGDGT